MPLLRYFGFVGSALVTLLFGLSWCFPQPVSDRTRSGIDRSIIRINSVEKVPDRVDIDTSLPTIVPPPSVMDVAEQQPVVKLVETNVGPKPTSQTAGHDVPKKQAFMKREPMKKVALHRATPAIKNEHGSNYRERGGSSVTRLSLLDLLKERLGHGFFTVN